MATVFAKLNLKDHKQIVIFDSPGSLIEAREQACDESVLRSGIEPEAYGEGILKVCELYLKLPLPFVTGVTGSNLKPE